MNRECISADQWSRIVATTDGKSIALLPPPTPRSLDSFGSNGSLNVAIAAIATYSSHTSERFRNPLFRQAIIRREALASARMAGIDGNFTELMYDELSKPEQDSTKSGNRLRACIRSITSVVGVSNASRPLMFNLREAHAILSYGDLASDPGIYRSGQIWNGSHRIEMARYVPPPAAFIPDCLSNLEDHLLDYYCGKTILSVPLQLAVAHAQFSNIQPFCKHNEIISRMIAPSLIHTLGYPPLFMSSFWIKYASEYEEALIVLQLTGDWSSWISLYVDAIIESINNTINYINIVDEINFIWKKKTALLRQSRIIQEILEFIAYVPVFNISILQKNIQSNYQVINRSLSFLIDVDIIKPLNNKKRNRVFLASDILELPP